MQLRTRVLPAGHLSCLRRYAASASNSQANLGPPSAYVAGQWPLLLILTINAAASAAERRASAFANLSGVIHFADGATAS